MPEVRELAGRFNLFVETHDFKVSLTGLERNKRKLLGHIATHNSYGYFSSTRTLESMFPNFDVQQILASLVEICQRSELFINDYALSNLLVHLMVIIIRLTSNNELSEVDGPIDGDGLVAQLSQRDQIVRCAEHIASYFEQEFGCEIPRADFQQILLLLALSIERVEYRELDFEKLASIIDPAFVDTVLEILDETGARYNIPHFIDEPMRLQLVLHMFNAYQRAVYHVSYPNPLASQIKSEYAPVYDMAVDLTHRFSTVMNVEIGENEIAFVAFHIGAYFERVAAPNLLTCTVIVEDYHDFAHKLVDDLEIALKDEAQIISIMSCDRYLSEPPECDAVITTIDVTVPAGCEKILIGPILTKQNLRKVRDRLARIQEKHRHNYARTLLRHLIKPGARSSQRQRDERRSLHRRARYCRNRRWLCRCRLCCRRPSSRRSFLHSIHRLPCRATRDFGLPETFVYRRRALRHAHPLGTARHSLCSHDRHHTGRYGAFPRRARPYHRGL